MTGAALVRESIDSLSQTEERQRRFERARRAIGAFASGTTDTAEHHDDAFVEALTSN